MSNQYPPTSPQPSGAGTEQTWAALAHLGGIFAYAFAGWLPALVIWLVHKDKSARIAFEARSALNFQLTLLIGLVACQVLQQIPVIGWIAWIAQIGLGILSLVLSIMAFLAVQRGESYTYPYSLTLVR